MLWQRPSFSRRPWVLGHRGVGSGKIENTLEAFELASQQGADGVELDVRLGPQAKLIVFHDATLERMTSSEDKRSVEELSLEEFGSLRLNNGARIPCLSSVLSWSQKQHRLLNIEVKRDVSSRSLMVFALAEALRRQPSREHILLSSFDPWIVRNLAQLLADIPVAWLVHSGQRVLSKTPGLGLTKASAVHPEEQLITAGRLEDWKRRGFLVNAWTVNDPKRALELSQWGIDSIITDHPADILPALS